MRQSELKKTLSTRPCLPLRYLVMVVGALIVLFAVVVTAVINDRVHVASMKEDAQKLAALTHQRVKERLADHVSMIEREASLTVEMVESGLLNPFDQQVLTPFLLNQVVRVPGIDYAYFANMRGGLLTLGIADDGEFRRLRTGSDVAGPFYSFRADAKGREIEQLSVRDHFDPRERGWYQSVRNSERAYWTDVYTGAIENVLGISFAYPLFNEKGALQGVFGFDLILSQLSEYLHQIRASMQGQIFVLDNAGKLIASSDDREPVFSFSPSTKSYHHQHYSELDMNLSGIESELKQFLAASRSDVLVSQNPKGLIYLSSFKLSENRHWTILTFTPKQEFMAQVDQSRRTAVLWMLGAMLFAMAILLAVMRRLLEPLEAMSSAAQQIAAGDVGRQLTIKRQDELGALAHSFNDMSRNLQALFNQLEQRVEARTRALNLANDELRYQAEHDVLTGAFNRRSFLEQAEQHLKHSHRGAVLLMDVDHFKRVNDHHGHLAGDEVLRQLCSTVKALLSPGQLFARYGGEEFVLLADDMTTDDTILFAERIRCRLSALSVPFEGKLISFTVSIGIRTFDEPLSLGTLLQQADEAMYQAKGQGRDCAVLYASGGATISVERLKVLGKGLVENENS